MGEHLGRAEGTALRVAPELADPLGATLTPVQSMNGLNKTPEFVCARLREE
jgi:hypothetical protein